MQLDVTKAITQYDGTPMMDVDAKGEPVQATVRLILVNAVASPVEGDKPIDKFTKDELARRIYNAEKEVELTAEDVVLIKDRVGALFAPVVVGQIWRLLE
jgi:hypothetical protein